MKLVVLGSGESGVGTAILGKQKGYEVFVSDKGTIAKHYKEVLGSSFIRNIEKGTPLSFSLIKTDSYE